MPMSQKLLRNKRAGIAMPTDADARDYVLAVNAADGQPLETAVVTAIDAFVIGCKADGIWSALKASCILMGARTLSGALTPLVGTAPTNNNFVSGDYNRKTGLNGDATTKYLNSNRNVNADPQNSCHQAVYASAVETLTTRAYIGSGGTGTGSTQIRVSGVSGGDLFYTSRSPTTSTGISHNVAGFIGASRSAADRYSGRSSTGESEFVIASQTPFSGNALVFARLSSTLVAGSFSQSRLAFYSIGEGLSLAALDARVSALYSSIGAAIP